MSSSQLISRVALLLESSGVVSLFRDLSATLATHRYVSNVSPLKGLTLAIHLPGSVLSNRQNQFHSLMHMLWRNARQRLPCHQLTQSFVFGHWGRTTIVKSAVQGGTCGFGMRGQNSRSGSGTRPGFEGGQMPLYRRLPKMKGVAGGTSLHCAQFLSPRLSFLPVNGVSVETSAFSGSDKRTTMIICSRQLDIPPTC